MRSRGKGCGRDWLAVEIWKGHFIWYFTDISQGYSSLTPSGFWVIVKNKKWKLVGRNGNLELNFPIWSRPEFSVYLCDSMKLISLDSPCKNKNKNKNEAWKWYLSTFYQNIPQRPDVQCSGKVSSRGKRTMMAKWTSILGVFSVDVRYNRHSSILWISAINCTIRIMMVLFL